MIGLHGNEMEEVICLHTTQCN